MLGAIQSALFTLASLATGVLLQTTCFTVVNPPDDNGGTPPPDKVTVRMVNLSPFGLDPQLYASSQPLGDPATTLFIAENLRVPPGNFGTGIIQPGQTSEIEFDCEAATAVGTLGGRFLNGDGSEAGKGQQRSSPIGQVYSCTDILTFTYRSQDSTFTTSMSAGPAD